MKLKLISFSAYPSPHSHNSSDTQGHTPHFENHWQLVLSHTVVFSRLFSWICLYHQSGKLVHHSCMAVISFQSSICEWDRGPCKSEFPHPSGKYPQPCQDTNTQTHTQMKPLTPLFSFLLSSPRMSHSSVAIGYLAILHLMSITLSLFRLRGRHENWKKVWPKVIVGLATFSKKRERKNSFFSGSTPQPCTSCYPIQFSPHHVSAFYMCV